MGLEVVAISEKRCLTAALVGNILNSGQANTKAALRLAGQTPAVDPMEPGGGGISYYDGEKSIGGNTFGTDPAAPSLRSASTAFSSRLLSTRQTSGSRKSGTGEFSN